MIEFQTQEIKEFALFYAKRTGNTKAIEILENLEVANIEEANCISNFFWDLVDAAIKEQESGNTQSWDHGQEFLSEKVMYAISGYLERAGYENEWEQVSDSRNKS